MKRRARPGCSVENWECIRATAYLAPSTTAIGNAAALAYQSRGFEVALQVDTACAGWTSVSLPAIYSGQFAAFAAAFPGLQPQKTHRMRCSVWSDYATQPAVELGRGVRLDTTYSGLSFFTGSGMPMRFADSTGGLIDVYQAATQQDRILGESDPSVIDSLLARALGPEGYYGAFVANMKADWTFSPGSDQIVASAKARGVPVIAARQLLDWVDGRNESSFQALTWSGGTLTFSIAIGPNATGLQAMLPGTMTAGSLTTLTLNGKSVAFTRQTIKGIEYVLFDGGARHVSSDLRAVGKRQTAGATASERKPWAGPAGVELHTGGARVPRSRATSITRPRNTPSTVIVSISERLQCAGCPPDDSIDQRPASRQGLPRLALFDSLGHDESAGILPNR